VKITRILRPHAPRNLALGLIGIGTLVLILASIQHWQYVRKLCAYQPKKPLDISLTLACLIVILGLLMFWGVIFRVDPLG
jgi:hypothetical protein